MSTPTYNADDWQTPILNPLDKAQRQLRAAEIAYEPLLAQCEEVGELDLEAIIEWVATEGFLPEDGQDDAMVELVEELRHEIVTRMSSNLNELRREVEAERADAERRAARQPGRHTVPTPLEIPEGSRR